MATSKKRKAPEDDSPPLLPARGGKTTAAKKVVQRGKPKVREKTRKIFLKGDPDEDDDAPETRKSLRDAVAKVPPRRRTVAAEDTDEAIDAQDDEDGAEVGHFEMEGISQHSRRSLELEAQMQARVRNVPVFPFPHELSAQLRPYWVELVNSFPKDHFQVSDITLMKMYCQCAYDIERQSIKIEEEGEIVIGGRGQAIVNPRCKVRESNRNALMTLATKFRNQPASRQNTQNFGRNRRKSEIAGEAAQTLADDDDGLLARPGEDDDGFDEMQPPTRTRH